MEKPLIIKAGVVQILLRIVLLIRYVKNGRVGILVFLVIFHENWLSDTKKRK